MCGGRGRGRRLPSSLRASAASVRCFLASHLGPLCTSSDRPARFILSPVPVRMGLRWPKPFQVFMLIQLRPTAGQIPSPLSPLTPTPVCPLVTMPLPFPWENSPGGFIVVGFPWAKKRTEGTLSQTPPPSFLPSLSV